LKSVTVSYSSVGAGTWRLVNRTAALIVCAFILSGCGASKAIVKKAPSRGLGASTFFASLFDGPEHKREKPVKISKADHLPAIPMDKDGPRVRKFIRRYSEEDRRTMRVYMDRAEHYLPMVKRMASEHGLPEDVAYLFILESGGDPQARSRSNALGLWQFMPSTARSYGLRVDSWVDERLDPEKSTKVAMMYLKDLYGMFGCWRLALSAYNSGEKKLNRVLCQEDADQYEQICSSRKLKRETREFWPRFRAIAHIAKKPENYGFRALKRTISRPATSIVRLKGGYSITGLARESGVPASKLAALNPALLRGMTPPGEDYYELVTPAGTEKIIESRLGAVPRINRSRHVIHVVNKGDSIWGITRKYKITRDQLAGLNPDINLSKTLRAGVKLIVPKRGSTQTLEHNAQNDGPQQISMVR
jgi:membrane-bound lytic murein transglycosylase D